MWCNLISINSNEYKMSAMHWKQLVQSNAISVLTVDYKHSTHCLLFNIHAIPFCVDISVQCSIDMSCQYEQSYLCHNCHTCVWNSLPPYVGHDINVVSKQRLKFLFSHSLWLWVFRRFSAWDYLLCLSWWHKSFRWLEFNSRSGREFFWLD